MRKATTGAKRDPLLPELPTVADVLPRFESTLWWGVAAPAKTPASIVTRVHAESPSEFTAFIKAERERIARVGRQVGITLD
jgi:hypothetical protein